MLKPPPLWLVSRELLIHTELFLSARDSIHCVRDASASSVEEEWNSLWVRALPGLMHLGLKTGPLCPVFCTKLKEPCSFNKVTDDPYT